MVYLTRQSTPYRNLPPCADPGAYPDMEGGTPTTPGWHRSPRLLCHLCHL